jgi:hypothetical protein
MQRAARATRAARQGEAAIGEERAAQRRVPPGAPMQRDDLDRDEMPVSGVGIDDADGQGRAAHSALRAACRPAEGLPGPRGGLV